MRRRSLLAGAAASPFAPAAPMRPAAAQGAKVVKFIPHADLGIVDPVITTAYITRIHAFLAYDTLYGMDAEFRIQPQMV